MKNIVVISLLLTMSGAVQAQKRTAFEPGQVWPDNRGVHLNAHGGGVLFD